MTLSQLIGTVAAGTFDPKCDATLERALRHAEEQVRKQPRLASHRWVLFQILCVMEQWVRATRQLQTYALLDAKQTYIAQVYRELVRLELRRARVMKGRERPGFVCEPPEWVEGLVDALRLTAEGRRDEADCARGAALGAAPLVGAQSGLHRTDWIADSDSRLGPVCEIIVAGDYRWVPMSEIRSWHVHKPAALIDLVWAPCMMTLADGSGLRGFMPARYPGSGGPQHATNGIREGDSACDALRLGHTTIWDEVGQTGVIALGQKTWTTSAGDFSLFDLASCEFGNVGAINAGATNDTPSETCQ